MLGKKSYFVLFVTLLSILILGACSSGTTSDSQEENSESSEQSAVNESTSSQENHRLLLGTSSQGASYYVWGAGWANIMNQTISGLDISVEVTGGPTTNIQLIEEEEMELGFVTTWLGGEGFTGTGWADKKYENMRALFPMYPSVLYAFGLQGSGMDDIYAFHGEHISLGAPGTTSDAAGREVMDLLEIEPSNISSLPTNTAIDNLKDGVVSGSFAVSGVPAPFLLDLETTHDIKHIEFSEEDIEKILEANPYWSKLEVSADTYKDIEEDMTLIAFWNVAVGSKDLPDDLVYEMVKTTFEKHEDLVEVDPSARDALAENIVYSSIPLHPGALKYYEEIGIEIPSDLQ